MAAQDLEQVAQRLLSWLGEHDWRGYDPYDGLRTAPFRLPGRTGRQAVIQLYKHSPLNLRRLSGAEPYGVSKAYAVGISGAVRLGEAFLAERLAGRLVESRLESGLWGYEFDVQTRWAFYPAGSPNVIVSSFALHGLLDLGGHDGMVEESAAALAETFLRKGPQGPFFSYVLGSDTLIHNANLLAAAAMARAGRAHGRSDWEDLAFATAGVSVDLQEPDGSWMYGEAPNLRWIDGFHTAYNLVALRMLGGFDSALDRGLAFYLDHLFDSGGRPRLRSDRRGLLEVHTLATGLWCLALLADRSESARQTLSGCLRHAMTLRRSDGAFATTSLNRIPYIRWGQAHMLLGLAAAMEVTDK